MLTCWSCCKWWWWSIICGCKEEGELDDTTASAGALTIELLFTLFWSIREISKVPAITSTDKTAPENTYFLNLLLETLAKSCSFLAWMKRCLSKDAARQRSMFRNIGLPAEYRTEPFWQVATELEVQSLPNDHPSSLPEAVLLIDDRQQLPTGAPTPE